jgi:hypothetical protein
LLTRLTPTSSTAATAEHSTALHSEAELRDYLADVFGVRLADTSCCRGHTTPWRAFADAYFAESSVGVWKASRGFGGKSYLLSLLTLTEATTLGADVSVLGGSGEQATRVLEAMSKLWNYPSAPRHLLASDPARRETRFTMGNTVRALMASTRSARGPHPQRLRFDEVDETTLELLDAAMGQTMTARGVAQQTVLSSTHHYADGTFSEVLKRAREKRWRIYEWCWRESLEPHGWLARATVDLKRTEITEAMWTAEYDLQEPAPQGRAIMTTAVDAMFRRDYGEFAGDEGELVEIERPVVGATYAHGADWARSLDWTVQWTFRVDLRPMRLVCFLRTGRRPWPEMVGRFDRRITAFGGSAAHDATGIGDVIAGYLKNDATGIVLRGRDRDELFSGYIQAIEHGEVDAPMIDWAYREHKLVTTDDLYGGGHPPDSFVAGALAYAAAKEGRTGFIYH